MHRKGTTKNISSGRSRLVGITMGCPVGIGPEIILRFLASKKLPENCSPVVVGDIGVLRRCAKELQMSVEIIAWQPGEKVDGDKIQVIEPKSSEGYVLKSESLQWGVPGKETGHAAVEYIKEAVRFIAQGYIDAMVTCPISKYAIQMAGFKFPGHTELLASLCETQNFGMMMAGDRLKVSLVTIHTPLAKVAEQLDQAEVRRIINLTGETLVKDFGITTPRIAVAGFNPHGGEAGLFGEEEQKIIMPAVAEPFSENWEVSGPMPPDTVFKMAFDNRYDAVVAMYHDQGLIPFKLVHFEDGVNFTMGLPIIRTSVDHGTAYDIAGKGMASFSSLRAAFIMATQIISSRKKA
ncbi:MAG: 4-hydroxythreonine-4-phosphate dehydrogenase PdxA [Deltaproteobacteria bacterium]|nr:MAG: 4-hydroxythreonine-4-phosphate dehydrogenase PdxA [Deltaproteobacteria bacterium]